MARLRKKRCHVCDRLSEELVAYECPDVECGRQHGACAWCGAVALAIVVANERVGADPTRPDGTILRRDPTRPDGLSLVRPVLH